MFGNLQSQDFGPLGGKERSGREELLYASPRCLFLGRRGCKEQDERKELMYGNPQDLFLGPVRGTQQEEEEITVQYCTAFCTACFLFVEREEKSVVIPPLEVPDSWSLGRLVAGWARGWLNTIHQFVVPVLSPM